MGKEKRKVEGVQNAKMQQHGRKSGGVPVQKKDGEPLERRGTYEKA